MCVRNVTLSLLCVMLFGPQLDAAPLRIKEGDDPVTGKTVYLRNLTQRPTGHIGKRPSAQVTAQEFLKSVSAHFEIGNVKRDLKLSSVSEASSGKKLLRYQQIYKGVPVLGGVLDVRLRKNLSVDTIAGRMQPTPKLDSAAIKYTAESAKARAREHWMTAHTEEPVIDEPLLVIMPAVLAGNMKSSQPEYLVWQVEVHDPEWKAGDLYYIDAGNGEVVQTETLIRPLYREVYDCGRADYTCYLGNYDPAVQHTYGRPEGAEGVGPNPFFGGADTDLLYDYLGLAHRYFFERFGRNGANKVGGTGAPTMFVPERATRGYTHIHFSRYDDGYCPWRAYSAGVAVFFCTDMVVQDFVGHEYAHMVEYHSILNERGRPAGFRYYGESGAISEAFADIFGVAVFRHENREWGGDGSWQLGFTHPRGVLRDLSNPPSLNDGISPIPDRFHSPNVYCGTTDWGGSHHNSGVIEKAATLIADGGLFNGCMVRGIGRDREEELFYRTLNDHSFRYATFNDLYYAILNSCNDFLGTEDCLEVRKALEAVELNQPGACSGRPAAPQGICRYRDTTPPHITILSPQSFDRVKGDTSIQFTDDELTHPRCALRGFPAVPCSKGMTMADLPGWGRGKDLTLTVTDTDRAGNVGSDTVERLRRAVSSAT